MGTMEGQGRYEVRSVAWPNLPSAHDGFEAIRVEFGAPGDEEGIEAEFDLVFVKLGNHGIVGVRADVYTDAVDAFLDDRVVRVMRRANELNAYPDDVVTLLEVEGFVPTPAQRRGVERIDAARRTAFGPVR